ncbi:MAG: molybdopterin-binding protein [Aestuariivirgaceae bacterium]
MKFGEIAIGDAEGAVVAHSVHHQGGVFKKGHVLSADDVDQLKREQVRSVFAVKLAPDDVAEDEAAAMIAAALSGANTSARDAATGRANIMSASHGVAIIDAQRINRLNHIHESLTVATVSPHDVLAEGQMLATVKVIPFAVPRPVLDEALALLGDAPALSVVPLQERKVALIITKLASTKDSLVEKSKTAMRQRIDALGGDLTTIDITDHRIDAVGAAIARAVEDHDPVLVFGASAIVDRGDVIPAGLLSAGGAVKHLGMPVDPGNLLMLGELRDVQVIGVPSCARSPKTNGFDWVLSRVLAGLEVRPGDIMDMGVGGLLQEIASRPLPREAKT